MAKPVGRTLKLFLPLAAVVMLALAANRPPARAQTTDPVEAWTRQFGTTSDDWAYSLAVDGAGNIYVAGSTNGALPGQTSAGEWDDFVRKYDSSGTEGWTRQFGPASSATSNGVASSVAVDGAGNVYVAGYTYGALPGQTSAGGWDAFVRKYDSSGTEGWTRQFGSTFGSDDLPSSVAVDGAGNVYVAGDTYGALPGQTQAGGRDAFVRKIDSSGNEVWTRQFGTPSYDEANGIAVDGVNSVYLAGHTGGVLPGQTSAGLDAFVRKYSQGAVALAADLSITKADSPDPVTVGSNLAYKMVVKNSGPDTATGVIVTDTLPAGLNFVAAGSTLGTCAPTAPPLPADRTVRCTLGTVGSGTSATVGIVVKPTTGAIVTNVARVKANESDPKNKNNTASAVTTVPGGMLSPFPAREDWRETTGDKYADGSPHYAWGANGVARDYAPAGVFCKDAQGEILMYTDTTHHIVPMAAGKVIKKQDYWLAIDHGNGRIGFYLHVADGTEPVIEGQTVSTTTILGHPSLYGGFGPDVNSGCHVHVALAAYTASPVVGNWDPNSAAWLPSFPMPPLSPIDLKATPASGTTLITLTWIDQARTEKGFLIYRDNIPLQPTATDVTTYAVDGLTPGSRHCYAVAAFNDFGRSPRSSTVCVVTSSN